MDPGGKIYTIDEFRCWKVENLDDEGSDENKNEKEGYRVVSPQKVSRFAPLNRIHANPRETKSGRGSRVCHAPPKRTQYSPKLWHFVICKYLYYSAHAQTQKY
jgi:hypothetical protein